MDAYAVRYPTNVADVARVIEEVACIAVQDHKDLPPILHFQATEAMTKYDSESSDFALLAALTATPPLRSPSSPLLVPTMLILTSSRAHVITSPTVCNVMCRLQNRFAPPLPEASVTHIDPEYEIDPVAATSRPRHCKMDTSMLQSLGVDVTHVSFESWWAEEMGKVRDSSSDHGPFDRIH